MQTLAYKSFVGGCLMSPYICLRKQGDTKPKVKNPRRVSSEIVFFHINGLGRDGFPSRFFYVLLQKKIVRCCRTICCRKTFVLR